MLNNNYSDYSLAFAFFQVVSLADHLGNPRLGMKSEDSDYQGSSEYNIQFPTNGANTISNAGTFATISVAKVWFGSQYI